MVTNNFIGGMLKIFLGVLLCGQPSPNKLARRRPGLEGATYCCIKKLIAVFGLETPVVSP